MKTPCKSIFGLLLISVLALSCSRKKDKFINRNYHAITAEFNALYNGYNALEQGRQTLNEAYFDNYWEVLPIERMQIFEDVVLPGQSKNESFSRAEEKAAKAIQKHSINIEGKEKNPQMDEAYLLLGKARYFDQRFVPSLEAFNYILYKYPVSDKINQAKVWREKANIRLDNNELAIENLKRLLKQEELEGQDLADATSILAQAYLNVKVVDTAITLLETASNVTKSNDERGRYRFIQGQLYNQLGYKDSANIAFDRVIELNRKTPRIYMISAYLEKIKNFDFENGNKLELTELLSELEGNRENRPFLDRIYHQIAEYHLQNGSDSLAVAYYNMSLNTKSEDNVLVAKNYETLGDMNFDASVYAKAGKYYDSTMGSLVENSKPYRIIKRKRDNLEDVIYYEAVAKVNDSVLNLVKMTDAERLAYFEGVVQRLEEQAEAEEKAQEAAERNSGLITANNQPSGQRIGPPVNNQQANTFYFYNPTTVAYGKNEFVKIWGDRKLEDNWRWSSKAITAGGSTAISAGDVVASASEDERFNPQFYISKIPSEEKEIDSISKERNYAYYQLGLIYKEKFREFELAKTKFQDLLNSNPEERLVLPSKYNLYRIYEALGENDEAAIAKQKIISEYPKSRYALILTNPELVSNDDENSPRSLYESLYNQYVNQEFAEVILKSEDYINQFDGDPIVPKFELLKATAIGRLRGYQAYKEAINHVAVTYANTPEGKEAQEIETEILPNLASNEFVAGDNESGNYKVVFKFTNAEGEEVMSFKKSLDEVIKNVKYYNLKSSMDVYSPDTKLVLVHGLRTEQVAKTFDQLLTKEDWKKIKATYFVVSSANYQIIQIHKNLNTYLNLDNN